MYRNQKNKTTQMTQQNKGNIHTPHNIWALQASCLIYKLNNIYTILLSYLKKKRHNEL